MATYVIGDIQGCFDELRSLLDAIPFKSDRDTLWFVGDLINRGPKNLATLRFIKGLQNQAVTVLGNHDLHFLAIYFGGHKILKSDTFDDVMRASDLDSLAQWLRSLPLIVHRSNDVLVHAGIPHIWDLTTAKARAKEVEAAIQGSDFRLFFQKMYGNNPANWEDGLESMDRLRVITNYFTRMRFMKRDGTMDFTASGTLDETPPGYKPWFHFDSKVHQNIFFGHWAAIDGFTGSEKILATDTGCVWGRGLTAIRLSDKQRFVWLENQLIKAN